MVKSLCCVSIISGLILSVMSGGVLVYNNDAIAQEKGVAYKEIEVKDGGNIVGTVKFDGDVPAGHERGAAGCDQRNLGGGSQ